MSNARFVTNETVDRSPKEHYDRALRVVEYNTSWPDGPSEPGMRLSEFFLIGTAYGRYDTDATKNALQSALNNDDLLLWRDREGDRRVTRTTENMLRALVAHENRQLDPTTELIERCAELIHDDGVNGGETR